MSAEIIRVAREHLPALRFIGKCYTDADRGPDGGFGNRWGEWFANGWFERLKNGGVLQGVENGALGLMGCSDQENSFQYWIGFFYPENAPVPEGFTGIDIPEGDIGVCWIRGHEGMDDLYGQHCQCMERLTENGVKRFREDFKGPGQKWWWFFERYNEPRFTVQNEDGTRILDYAIYID